MTLESTDRKRIAALPPLNNTIPFLYPDAGYTHQDQMEVSFSNLADIAACSHGLKKVLVETETRGKYGNRQTTTYRFER